MSERIRGINSLLFSVLLIGSAGIPAYAKDNGYTDHTGLSQVDHKWPAEGNIVFESNIYGSGQNEKPENYRDAIVEAAADWNEVGSGPEIVYSHDIQDGADPKYDGRNQIIFMDRGPKDKAISTVLYYENGVVVEADIRVNRKLNWSAGDHTDSDEIDFGSAILHEFGHIHSLDHSSNQDAVMYPRISTGEVRDELTPEDKKALINEYAK